jgi:hypothetical protein
VRVAALVAILTGLAGLLARIPLLSIESVHIDLAVVVMFAAAFFFLLRDWLLGLGVLSLAIIVYLMGAALPVAANVIVLAAGCVFCWLNGGFRRWS